MVYGNIVNPGTPPCKDCKDRHMRCHSTCAKYAKFREDYDAKTKAALKSFVDYTVMEGHAKRRGRVKAPIDGKMRKGERRS